MDTKGRLIAGSHNRNEFVLINTDEIGRVSAPQICLSLSLAVLVSNFGVFFGFSPTFLVSGVSPLLSFFFF
ncbi:unnamed protein product [Coffea canephora]|uniref:Transmembrane protein n=1 Tax=Coffea canephora TaxID=49390 RepID=A0A068V0T9_COFCA|nr:unnamed protein product [Coffea canephora]